MFRSPKALAGLAILGFFTVAALLAPLGFGDPTAPVGLPLMPPSWSHWLGTTGQGQDVLAQTLFGARTSLLAGVTVARFSQAAEIAASRSADMRSPVRSCERR